MTEKGSKKVNRTHLIFVRTTLKEKQKIEQAAQSHGLATSAYIRTIILKQLG